MANVLDVFLLLAILSAAAGDQNKLNNLLFNGDYEFIDLTHPFDEKTVYWPNGKSFSFTEKIAERKSNGLWSWYASNNFAAGEHGGTHIDAPYHFAENGKHVGDIPVEDLILPLIIVDVSSIANDDPNFVLHKQHLDHILNDNLGKKCVIVFKFGWAKYFQDRDKYLGYNPNNKTLNFPGLSSEIAQWIATSYKNIVGVGVDVASLDPGSSNDFPVHSILMKAGLYGIENINLNTALPEYGCTALVLPMKIAMGTGAPLRMVAICPKKMPTSFEDKN